MKKMKSRTPGSRNVMHRKPNMTSKPVCSGCGSLLHGMRRMGTARFANSSASSKRVSRMFGGSMCPSCSRDALRSKARSA